MCVCVCVCVVSVVCVCEQICEGVRKTLVVIKAVCSCVLHV